jgi:N-acetylglucosamine kinase-like BadF-type ATPase
LANIDRAISLAFAEAGLERRPVTAATLAIAGTGSEPDQQRLQLWCRQQRIADQSSTTHDAQPVLAQGTTGGIGVALISGTGSFVFGQNAKGETARAGGWGHTIGDQGSGYSIALAGLRAITRSHDKLSPATSLESAVCSRLDMARATDLREFLSTDRADVTGIAALAPIVIAEADAGDSVAAQIVDESARELANLVTTVASQLFGLDDRCELAMSGGMLVQSKTLRDRLLEHLAALNVMCARTEIVAEPIRGAILIARDLVTGQRT